MSDSKVRCSFHHGALQRETPGFTRETSDFSLTGAGACRVRGSLGGSIKVYLVNNSLRNLSWDVGAKGWAHNGARALLGSPTWA